MLTIQQGNLAENYACAYLQQAGLTLITRNYRCRYGEIDLIMQQKNMLVFVEVRYRGSLLFGSPIESITAPKRHRLQQSADHYLQKYDKRQQYDWRFDWMGLTPLSSLIPAQSGKFRVEWIKNAFEIDY